MATSLRMHANVGGAERWMTALAGLGLFALAVRMPRARRPLGAASMALLLRGATGYCPAYAAAGVDAAGDGRSDTARALGGSNGVLVESRAIIARPAAEVFAFWRDLTQLAHALPESIHVEAVSDTESRWSLAHRGLPTARWSARIINEEPGRLIGWKTIDDADVVSAGSVRFTPAPGDRATEVQVRFQYSPPLGRVGAGLASLVRHGADDIVKDALRRIKARLEADDYTSLAAW